MRWDGDGDGVGGDDDLDLDDARDDGDDDGDDLPFREVFSPVEYARRRWLFFSVGFRHGAAGELRNLFYFLGFSGDEGYICQRGDPGVAPGVQTASRRAPGEGRATSPPGHLVAPLRPAFLILRKNNLC